MGQGEAGNYRREKKGKQKMGEEEEQQGEEPGREGGGARRGIALERWISKWHSYKLSSCLLRSLEGSGLCLNVDVHLLL